MSLNNSVDLLTTTLTPETASGLFEKPFSHRLQRQVGAEAASLVRRRGGNGNGIAGVVTEIHGDRGFGVLSHQIRAVDHSLDHRFALLLFHHDRHPCSTKRSSIAWPIATKSSCCQCIG
jgi:hypothetical protein